MTPITLDIVKAYSLCPRKAFLFLMCEPLGVPHEYVRIIEEQEVANRQAYRASLARAANATDARGLTDLMAGHDVILDAAVVADDLEARCDALRRGKATAGHQGCGYEPVKILGTRRGTKSQVLGLAYVGHVLGHVQRHSPAAGTLVPLLVRPVDLNLFDFLKRLQFQQFGIKLCKSLTQLRLLSFNLLDPCFFLFRGPPRGKPCVRRAVRAALKILTSTWNIA